MAEQDFAGRVVIATGGASGQGRVAAELFAARGASVVVVVAGTGGAGANRAAEALGGRRVAADVAQEADGRQVVEFACERYGSLDVLFNNAGVGFSAEEVGRVAIFLASSGASYLNGVILPVDGGGAS